MSQNKKYPGISPQAQAAPYPYFTCISVPSLKPIPSAFLPLIPPINQQKALPDEYTEKYENTYQKGQKTV